MAKNKILILSKENRGGTGTFLNQSLLFDRNKFKINYYFFKEGLTADFRGKPVILSKSYPSYQRPSLYKFYLLAKNLFRIQAIIRSEKPDLIFACDQYSAITALASKFIFMQKIPIIVLIGSNLHELLKDKPDGFYRLLLLRTIKFFYRRAEKLIFVSNDLSKDMENKFKFGKRKSIVIRNAIDLTKLKEINKRTRITNLRLVSIGRLAKPKDFETIIKAFSTINKNIPDTKLFIVGEGELRNSLEKLSDNLGLKNKIRFLGWQKNIFSILQNADLFLFSSLYEGFSYVILEAMATKVPVIATDTPYGPSEILDKGKYGILVPMKSYKKMAYEAETLLKNPALRKQLTSKAFIRTREFNLQNMIKQYEDLFIKLIINS